MVDMKIKLKDSVNRKRLVMYSTLPRGRSITVFNDSWTKLPIEVYESFTNYDKQLLDVNGYGVQGKTEEVVSAPKAVAKEVATVKEDPFVKLSTVIKPSTDWTKEALFEWGLKNQPYLALKPTMTKVQLLKILGVE